MSLAIILGLLACISQAHGAETSANPIRKVVTMLQSMQKKVEQEGAKEKDLFEKFMCFCKTNGADLTGTIGVAEEKIPAVSSSLQASQAKLAGSKSDLKRAQEDRSAAKDAIAQATALRKKEAAAFASLQSDYNANIAAVAKAISALEKGMAGSFLQTPYAATLRKAMLKSELAESDQQALSAFLTVGSGYIPRSGEITGILKQMHDEMSAGLSEATAAEKSAIKSYQGLMSAKTKEVAALTATVEAKTQQIGELGVSIVNMENDLEDTQAELKADQTFLAELKTGCATKQAEWDERSKTRADELVTLADTIKVLNDDDALELFKKTLPSPSSLLQVQETTSAVKARALRWIKDARSAAGVQGSPALALLELRLKSKRTQSQGGFDKVIKMIDEMVAILGKEQNVDDDKKEYCALQFDVTEDKMKDLKRHISNKESAIATNKEAIATLTQEIAALGASIKALDKAVGDATEQRKQENSDYKALVASDSAAKELLLFAKNRLNKFYNSKLYKAPAKTELSADDRVYSNIGGKLEEAAPGGIAGTGVTVFAQISAHSLRKVAPQPPPETWGAYASKSGQGRGVIEMIDLLIKDLDKELQEAGVEEKNAQEEYEVLMKESAAKRTTDSKSLTGKTSEKADTEAELQSNTDSKASGAKELMATAKYDASLHAECDWLLQYFDARKEARASEVESLKNSKAVLSGADYSFLQTGSSGFLTKLQ